MLIKDSGWFSMVLSMRFGFRTWTLSSMIIWHSVWQTANVSSWDLNWECCLKCRIYQWPPQLQSVVAVWCICPSITCIGHFMCKVGLRSTYKRRSIKTPFSLYSIKLYRKLLIWRERRTLLSLSLQHWFKSQQTFVLSCNPCMLRWNWKTTR